MSDTIADLIPPDTKQCQVEKPNGHTFMTMGGIPGLIRCKNKPFVIVLEKEPDEDGLMSSMSMCEGCLVKFNEQWPNKSVTVNPIIKKEDDKTT